MSSQQDCAVGKLEREIERAKFVELPESSQSTDRTSVSTDKDCNKERNDRFCSILDVDYCALLLSHE